MNAIHARSQLRYWPTYGKNFNSSMGFATRARTRCPPHMWSQNAARANGCKITASPVLSLRLLRLYSWRGVHPMEALGPILILFPIPMILRWVPQNRFVGFVPLRPSVTSQCGMTPTP